MEPEKGKYFNLLTQGNLSKATIDTVLAHITSLGLRHSEVPPSLIKKNEHGEKITEYLTRLELRVIEGNPSWEGLFVGFPGNVAELSTKSVGTPYLRSILYPILDLHHRLQKIYPGKKFPCIYFVGKRFSDVFLRKFDLLRNIVPHIIVLTHDIYECSKNKIQPPETKQPENFESWTQMKLSKIMFSKESLLISTRSKDLTIKYLPIKFLASEVLCYEGTENPERLDILGYDVSDHSLIAFELKGKSASEDRVELENLFLQGIEHRNWLEKNKMAVKLLFDRGHKGKRINTKKRVRLLLGFYGENVPYIFYELRDQYKRRDRHIEIYFVRITNIDHEIELSSFKESMERS